MPNARTKALLFDFDGTVMDTEVPAFQSWQEIYAQHRQTLSLEDWAACLGTVGGFDPISHLEQLSGVRIKEPETLLRRRWARKMELLANVGLRPGLDAHLTRASQLRLKVAIVSSDSDDWIASNLARLDRGYVWDLVNCANGDISRAKPLPCLYEEALTALELRPHEAIAFEDSPNGIRAAKAAGLFCVVVANPVTRELDLSGGDLYLNSFEHKTLDEVLHAAQCFTSSESRRRA